MDVSIVALKATIRKVTASNLKKVQDEVVDVISKACDRLELPAGGQEKLQRTK